jgi:simple sugar transport system ATP-binding protein
MSDPGTSEKPAVLEVESVTKSYGAVRALQDVSFVLHAGEVLGLVGDNGAGKSTIVKTIAGSIKPDSGRIILDGVEQKFGNARHARDAGIETIFQDVALIRTLDIAANIFLNREVFSFGALGRALRIMDTKRMHRECAEGFGRLGLQLPPPETKTAALSGGQRQTVAVARAVMWGRRVVLMDEPAAALSVRAADFVLSFVERLKQEDVAVVFVSHNLAHVLQIADRMLVLRLGEKVFDGPRADVSPNRLVSLITGLETEERIFA